MSKSAKVAVTDNDNINIELIDEANICGPRNTGNNENDQQISIDHSTETNPNHDAQHEEARIINNMFGGNNDSDDDDDDDDDDGGNMYDGHIDGGHNYHHYNMYHDDDQQQHHGHGYNAGNMYGGSFYHRDDFIYNMLLKLNLSKYNDPFNEFNITEQALQHLDDSVVEFLIIDEKDRDKFLKWLIRYKIEFDLDELKVLRNNIKYPVFGYIRECQAILPHHINPYYNIPQLIRWLILFYYHFMCDEKLSDTDFLQQILESDANFEINADAIFDIDDDDDDDDDVYGMMIKAETPSNISGDELLIKNQHKDVVIDDDTIETVTANLNENDKLLETHE